MTIRQQTNGHVFLNLICLDYQTFKSYSLNYRFILSIPQQHSHNPHLLCLSVSVCIRCASEPQPQRQRPHLLCIHIINSLSVSSGLSVYVNLSIINLGISLYIIICIFSVTLSVSSALCILNISTFSCTFLC